MVVFEVPDRRMLRSDTNAPARRIFKKAKRVPVLTQENRCNGTYSEPGWGEHPQLLKPQLIILVCLLSQKTGYSELWNHLK